MKLLFICNWLCFLFSHIYLGVSACAWMLLYTAPITCFVIWNMAGRLRSVLWSWPLHRENSKEYWEFRIQWCCMLNCKFPESKGRWYCDIWPPPPPPQQKKTKKLHRIFKFCQSIGKFVCCTFPGSKDQEYFFFLYISIYLYLYLYIYISLSLYIYIKELNVCICNSHKSLKFTQRVYVVGQGKNRDMKGEPDEWHGPLHLTNFSLSQNNPDGQATVFQTVTRSFFLAEAFGII